MGPHEVDEAQPGVAERQRRLRVRDRGLDLEPVPDDRRVGEEASNVRGTETRDTSRVEIRERTAKTVALPQDRQPRQAGLEAFEAELLEQAALVDDRPAPLAVVVRAVDLDVLSEAALDAGQDGTSVSCAVYGPRPVSTAAPQRAAKATACSGASPRARAKVSPAANASPQP